MSSFEDRPELPMPPDNEWSIHEWNFFRYVWDTTGVPLSQEVEGAVIITPQVGRLTIYGRLVRSRYAEDRAQEEKLAWKGKIMGEWFSTACPHGELGPVPLAACTQISAEEFSAAYQRGWA